MTFEQSISRLNEIVGQLEKSSNDLDKSLKLFEEGTTLIRECNIMLDNAEQKVRILTENGEITFND